MITFQVNFYSFAKKNVLTKKKTQNVHICLWALLWVYTYVASPCISNSFGLFIFGGSYSNKKDTARLKNK